MFMLYFGDEITENHHAFCYDVWTGYDDFHPGECLWLIPGTDPDDPDYK